MTKVVTLILINQLVAMGLESGDARLFIATGAIGGILVAVMVTVGLAPIVRGILLFLANLALLIGLFLIFLSGFIALAWLAPIS